ncbi:MAG: hypothetical protein NE334_12630, partial [Lentisphaeraceae bacterium]|nr:hypothetical protein [Lentisphaeraceae bacterium]
ANIFMENPPDPLEDRELERIKLTALTADVYSFITLLYSNRQIVDLLFKKAIKEENRQDQQEKQDFDSTI